MFLYDVSKYRIYKDPDEKLISSNWADYRDFLVFPDVVTVIDCEFVLSVEDLPIEKEKELPYLAGYFENRCFR